MPSASQQIFDERYITATEIAREVGVSRVAVHHARHNGLLPNPIVVGDNLVCIWERRPVRKHLEKWKSQVAVKKGVPA